MNRIGMNAIFPFSRSSDEDAEIEVLQADVMRFMAILGFILTIIFALVQSLPFTPQNSRPTAEQESLLSTDITALKRHIQGQLAILKSLRKEIELAEKLKETALTEAQDATQYQQRILNEAGEVKSALDESYQSLQVTEGQIKRQTRSLRMIRLRIEEERRHLEVIQSRTNKLLQSVKTTIEPRARVTTNISNSQQQSRGPERNKNKTIQDLRITRIQDELKQIQKRRQLETNKIKKKNPSSPKRTVSPKPSSPKGTPVPRRNGFTLKFESDAAFDRLLKAKAIRFFVIIGDKAWQAHLAGSVPRFLSDRRPPRYYQMDSVTVPAHYVATFSRVVAAHKRDSVVWGVVLPDRMIKNVNKRIAGKTSGDVVIAKNGEIRMENVNP